MTGVDASRQEDAGVATIQIGCAKEVLGGTVSVAVAPRLRQIGLTVLEAFQWVVHNLIGLARRAIHVDKELVALVDEPLARAGGGEIVLGSVANDVFRAVGSVDDRTI